MVLQLPIGSLVRLVYMYHLSSKTDFEEVSQYAADSGRDATRENIMLSMCHESLFPFQGTVIQPW